MHQVHAVPTSTRRRHQIPWNRRYRALWTLGIKPRSFSRAARALSRWAIFTGPGTVFKVRFILV